MARVADLKPRQRPRLIDLVSEAGVNVSDWGSYRRGPDHAATNPAYCYQWAFVEPGRVVVLSLWYELMEEDAGGIVQHKNLREDARMFAKVPRKSAWKRRALEMDKAIGLAYREGLPVRVIICDGLMGDADRDAPVTSKVVHRHLDTVPWAVTAYDDATGDCELTRGVEPGKYDDQFSCGAGEPQEPTKHPTSGAAYDRDPEVRRRVLTRASGKCELCGEKGFVTVSGSVYLETHHVIPLSEKGPDAVENVVALCPNHHRQAHHAENREKLREQLTDYCRAQLHRPPGETRQ